MKVIAKIAVVSAMIVAVSTAARAEEGYIRIGESCFTYATIPGQYPFLIPVPCPRDVSEYP